MATGLGEKAACNWNWSKPSRAGKIEIYSKLILSTGGKSLLWVHDFTILINISIVLTGSSLKCYKQFSDDTVMHLCSFLTGSVLDNTFLNYSRMLLLHCSMSYLLLLLPFSCWTQKLPTRDEELFQMQIQDKTFFHDSSVIPDGAEISSYLFRETPKRYLSYLKVSVKGTVVGTA